MEKWFQRPVSKDMLNKIAELQKEKRIKVSNFALQYLVYNGYDTVEKINSVLNFKKHDIPDIYLMQDAEKFIKRLIKAAGDGEEITIHGDYDADGINATAIFVKAMQGICGNKINYFVSHRFSEGYGISVKSVSRLLNEFPNTSLIVTVDNGISAFEGVEYANGKGIDVIISDHHEPKEDGSLPNALAVVDMKRLDDKYPFKELCGAGLIYKLMCKLYEEGCLDVSYLDYLLPLVACATVGDVVSLTGENRYYVKEGIKEMKKETLRCFQTMRQMCDIGDIDEETLGFKYVPILNAIGRMDGNVIPAIDFLLENDVQKSQELMQKLFDFNERRKELCTEEEVISLRLLEQHKDDEVIILSNETFHEGTIGIVAGRIKERTLKPTIVLTKSETPGVFKGSSRSVPGFNMKKALDKLSHLLLGYGGHELAAGLSIKEENVEPLRAELCTLAMDDSFYKKDDMDKFYIDFALGEDDINVTLVNAINVELRPFGQGFPKPVFGLKEFHASNVLTMPKDAAEADKKHVKLSNDKLAVLWFNAYKDWVEMGMPTDIKCIGMPSVNIFRGNINLQFQVENNRLRKAC